MSAEGRKVPGMRTEIWRSVNLCARNRKSLMGALLLHSTECHSLHLALFAYSLIITVAATMAFLSRCTRTPNYCNFLYIFTVMCLSYAATKWIFLAYNFMHNLLLQHTIFSEMSHYNCWRHCFSVRRTGVCSATLSEEHVALHDSVQRWGSTVCCKTVHTSEGVINAEQSWEWHYDRSHLPHWRRLSKSIFCSDCGLPSYDAV